MARNGRVRTAIDDPDRTIPIGPCRVNRAKLLARRNEIRFGLPISDPDPHSGQYQKPAETGKGGRRQRRQGKASGDLSERLPEK